MKKGISEKELFETIPVPRAVATLAIPTIISQVVTMIYNLADTFFVPATAPQFSRLQPGYIWIYRELSDLGCGAGRNSYYAEPFSWSSPPK